MATAWILAEGPLTELQGWKLVGLQRPGSAQEEMHTWEQVRAWAQHLSEATPQTDRQRAQDTTLEATLTMRSWFEKALRHAATYEDPEEYTGMRTELSNFIAHPRP